MAKKLMTVVHLYNNDQILLAMKKRDFGVGLWNGYGGKVRPEESVMEGALRELEEESGLRTEIVPAGILTFYYKGNELEIHYFRNSAFSGMAVETEEMAPQWFDLSAIPYDKMWPSDTIWLPKFLAGEELKGEFWLRDDGTVEKYKM